MTGPILNFQGVSFGYGGADVFSDLTLTVASGDFVAVAGPNGGGKSTLLKLAVGLLRPRCGCVRRNGADGNVLPGRQIGYVAQNPVRTSDTFPATVYELVMMGRTAIKGFFVPFNKMDCDIVRHVLELVGMWEQRGRLIGELSGGQQQRVYVARALAVNPKLLILDEPVTGIDAEARDRLYALLTVLNKNLNVTILLVSHDIERVLQYARTVICINNGILYHGTALQTERIHMALRSG